jgi:ribonuclease BN (tRNA processing enzyme)
MRYINKIIQHGDDSGNEMVVQFRLPSGLEIFGFPTKNYYGGHWDLGPTWNYAVMTDQPFLADAGRFGQGGSLVDMMEAAGIRPADLDFVLISHSHEDHDGGLAELVNCTHLNVRAHKVYDLLIRKYPNHIDRSAAVLEILNRGPMTGSDIAKEHFDEKLLEGFGSLMAANEIASHCELLIKSGDVAAVENSRYSVARSTNFERYINNLNPDF